MIKKPELYTDKVILAPMVRTNSLPFRLLCLEYGADLVYTEELIDYRLSKCRRLENKVLKTIDFVDDQNEVILRTCQIERERLILQIGSNNPERALKAATLASNDVVGIDFNFGCPKSFSMSGGMGAALLDKPDEIKALLTTSVETLNLPVTCKIRILPNLIKTLKLVKLIESCGVSAIAVHGRTPSQRSRDDNQNDVIKSIAQSVQIPVIANGGSNAIFSYADVLKFKERTSASSVMIGRSAMRNPSIFKPDNQREPVEPVIRRFLQLSITTDTYISNVKYALQTMMACGHYGSELVHAFHAASDYQQLCDIFNLTDWYEENRINSSKYEYYTAKALENEWLEEYIARKRRGLGAEYHFVCETIPFNGNIYGQPAPKGRLHDYVQKNKDQGVEIEVMRLEDARKGRFVCSMIYENVFYINKSHSKSKKAAEHATAMLVCDRIGLVKLDDYKTRINACTRNIT